MGLVCILLFLFQLVTANENCPSNQDIQPRDISGLESFVTTSSFSTIECFLKSLPQDVRALRTYAKTSLSKQQASPLFPRAIMASPDGGFFLTFNGHKDQKGYNEIEFLALDKNQMPTKWVAGILISKEGRLQIEKDSATCTSCHGQPVRPIWGRYPFWPNLYGSIDDWLPDEHDLKKDSVFFEKDRFYFPSQRLTNEGIKSAIEESRQFRVFKQIAQEHVRYKALEDVSDPRSPVYPFTEIYRDRNTAFRPNLILGSLMALRQNQILRQKIKTDSFFKSYKNSFFYYQYCTKKIPNSLVGFLSLEYENIFLTSPKKSKDFLSSVFFDIVTKAPHGKTLLFADDTFYLNESERNYFSGYYSIVEDVFNSLLEDEIETNWSNSAAFLYDLDQETVTSSDPILRKSPTYADSLYHTNNLDHFLNSGLSRLKASREGTVEQERLFKMMCQELSTLHQTELQQKPINTHKTSKSPKIRQIQPWPEALNSCIECHESSQRVASYIPFSSPEKIAEFNKTYLSLYGYGDLSDVVFMITQENEESSELNGLRMPLGRRPLTSQEQKDILNWINSAKH